VPLSEKQSYGLGLGLSIAFGLIVSSVIVSHTANRVAGNRQTITVKGLAEKPVQADQARWSVTVNGEGKTLALAFAAMRANRPKLQAFFKEQGFADAQLGSDREGYAEVFKRNAKNEQTKEIEGYVAKQTLMLSSNDVHKVEQAAGKIVALEEAGLPITVAEPEFLVSKLEAVKMSLIADATRNARERAAEFAKTSDAQVGAMKSASQGAFYILPAQGGGGSDDYGGSYDKSTIDKLARVVVTVEYGIVQ
jgi:hypothetical protein